MADEIHRLLGAGHENAPKVTTRNGPEAHIDTAVVGGEKGVAFGVLRLGDDQDGQSVGKRIAVHPLPDAGILTDRQCAASSPVRK